MHEQEVILCDVCGAPATHMFTNSGKIPLCDNQACEARTVALINMSVQLVRAHDVLDNFLKGAE